MTEKNRKPKMSDTYKITESALEYIDPLREFVALTGSDIITREAIAMYQAHNLNWSGAVASDKTIEHFVLNRLLGPLNAPELEPIRPVDAVQRVLDAGGTADELLALLDSKVREQMFTCGLDTDNEWRVAVFAGLPHDTRTLSLMLPLCKDKLLGQHARAVVHQIAAADIVPAPEQADTLAAVAENELAERTLRLDCANLLVRLPETQSIAAVLIRLAGANDPAIRAIGSTWHASKLVRA